MTTWKKSARSNGAAIVVGIGLAISCGGVAESLASEPIHILDGAGKSFEKFDKDFSVVVYGPIEAINSPGEIVVLGQTVFVTAATRSPADLLVGDIIVVAGAAFEGGAVASSIMRFQGAHNNGGLLFEVRGIITKVDELTGKLFLGGTTVDASNVVDIDLSQIAPGTFVEVSGTSPTQSGLILAATISGIDGSGVRGIDGSGVRGIDGSGVRGIDGSGVRGIDGSGVRGIDGSGVRGIDGSGVHGIDGSGSS